MRSTWKSLAASTAITGDRRYRQGEGKVFKVLLPWKAMTSDLPEGLRQLARAARKLAELYEWAKLDREQHRPHMPPSFQVSNHSSEEIRTQYTAFLGTLMDVKESLAVNAETLSHHQVRQWQLQIRQLESEVRGLNVSERFIRP